MQSSTADHLIELLREEISAPRARAALAIDADRYRSEAWLARERAALFGGPRIATASSAIAPSSCLPHDTVPLSALLVRGGDGVARAFHNACRHRGTRIVDKPCAAKAFVCPYHGWTYDLAGALVHAPHPEAFPGVDLSSRGLKSIDLAERHGARDETAVASYLGALDDDLAALALDRHIVWRTARVTRQCNWKLVIEAFLDGYHIRTLHRDSIYRFFIDAASVAERVGPHVRAVTGRRTLRDRAQPSTAEWQCERDRAAGDSRMLATPSFLLFPATVVVVHPDFVSIMTVHPLAPDRTDYTHAMLVPADRASEQNHWDKSWSLIEDTVFQKEDLWVCEQIQRGLAGGGVDELLFGSLECAAGWFHEAIDAALAS